MLFPFAKIKKSTWFWLFVLQTTVLLNYSEFLLLNRWTSNRFTFHLIATRWVIPIIMFYNEFNRIIIKRIDAIRLKSI
jgi:hypothetical protein